MSRVVEEFAYPSVLCGRRLSVATTDYPGLGIYTRGCTTIPMLWRERVDQGLVGDDEGVFSFLTSLPRALRNGVEEEFGEW